jgi:uncharacterized SAM-binding protein YcdF (DUF218 family)
MATPMRSTKRATVRQPVRTAPAWRLMFAAIGAAIFLVAAGFAWFVMRVQDSTTANDSADGVVVLTGGPDRIADAMDLLASGRGKRLLITGVNPATRLEELAHLMPRYAAMFNCCVDLDRSATNTIGNAVESRRWARARGFNSLIIVTSDYHMPRAMAELRHQLPGVRLIAYPVVTDRTRGEPWWYHAVTARTLAIEYVKFVAALVRMRIESDPTAGDRASAYASAEG